MAARLADQSTSGDVFLLDGPIGAGKSTFARAFIQHLLGMDTHVPSPTFTLVQSYESSHGPIHHYDLYRIESPDELDNIGLYDHVLGGISLIEWPDRLGSPLFDRTLTLTFEIHSPGQHSVSLTPHGSWKISL